MYEYEVQYFVNDVWVAINTYCEYDQAFELAKDEAELDEDYPHRILRHEYLEPVVVAVFNEGML